ncbi:MAG TPA: hypothetical protein VGR47_00120 [Terracidiphilus sp.]|nr:hypothetical protein [Terracidiphilus sp.]
MPKRNGPKKGHKCSEEFDRFCDQCWEERLKTMGWDYGRALHSSETTYIPQLELENSRSLPDGTDKDSHPGKCNCKVCRRRRREETRLLRVINGDPETTAETGAWKLDVPVILMSSEELDRLTSAVVLTFALRNKKRHNPRRIKDIAARRCYVGDVDSESDGESDSAAPYGDENKNESTLEESTI